jgi:hypothetical protein
MFTATMDPEDGRDPLTLLAPVVSAALLARPLPPPVRRDPLPLADTLNRLGLAGLVVAEGTANASPPLREALRAAVTGAGFHTVLTLDAARRALSLLQDAGIEALLFKGAALHLARVYRDPRARPLGDADLLVRAARANEAVRILEAGGFQPWEPWTDRHPGWVSAFTLDDGSAPAGLPVTLDLHWATDYTRLRHAPDWGGEILWEEWAPPLPAPEAHFVVTAEHLLKHLRVAVHLPAVADLVRLLPSMEVPGTVVRHAEARGSLPGLRAVVGLLLSLGAPVPAGLVEEVGGGATAAAAARRACLSVPELLARHPALPGYRSPSPLRDWLAPTGLRGTAREAARVLLPSAAWLRSRYPGTPSGWSRRKRYLADLVRWSASWSASPLSPNQGLP